MASNKPVIHGRDHLAGGADPIPFDASTFLFQSYSPALHASTTDPTGYTSSGKWIQIGEFVYAVIQVVESTSHANAGTGVYSVDLPVAIASGGVFSGHGYIYSGGFPPPFQTVILIPNGDVFGGASNQSVTLVYAATWPAGAETQVDDLTPWSWGDSGADHIEIVAWYQA